MISVTILTKNSEKYLPQVLQSLKAFNEIVIYDNGSTDQTLAIAEQFPNVSIFQGEFIGFGPTHNVASSCAKHHWILSVDADEIVTEDLVKEILALHLDETKVYEMQRDNFYNGKWIRWCGWYPEKVLRLYHRKKTRFSDAQVHESILAEKKKILSIKNSIHHFPYENTADFLKKMQHYSELFAEQHKGKRSSSLAKAIFHSWFTFFKSYFLKKGFLGGYEGFVISVYNANTAFYKYLKLKESNDASQHKFDGKDPTQN